MFEVFDYLEDKVLSERTLRKHYSNCALIGAFVAGYGYHEELSPEIFVCESDYLSEFKRKVSDSKYEIDS
ncbi:MAG: hypothetical protein F6K10_20140 [Moorea sp. SIO2B7]|nr:hypothetical protein [Moorena sp. SIO2B7]